MARQKNLNLKRVREFFHTRSKNHINYYVAPSAKFKSVTMRLAFTMPMRARSASINTIIPSVLRRGCARHPSLAALAQRCEELYGTTIRAAVGRIGQRQFLSLVLRFPSPRYLPGGMRDFRSCVEVLRELFCEPLLENGGFSPAIFASEQEQLVRSIRSLIDDKPSYALRKALEVSFPNSPLGQPEVGTEEDVLKLSPKTAYQHFLRMRQAAPLDLYISGDLDPQRHLPAIIEAFSDIQRRKPAAAPQNRAAGTRRKTRKATERHEMEQAFIVLTHTTRSNTASDGHAAFQFANAIFGRLTVSRLFRVIREEHGLAYSVGSMLDSSTGLSTAYAGVAPEHLSRVRRLMLKQLELLSREQPTEEEFEAARNSLINAHLSDQDFPGASIASLIVQQGCGVLIPPKKSLAQLRAVKPRDVLAAFARYRPCAEFRMMPRSAAPTGK